MPKAKHPVVEFNGIRYYRKPDGYYKSDFVRSGGKYLHREVWKHRNGEPPAGSCIHHVNGVKHDNRIENLVCLPLGAHSTHHGLERNSTEEGRSASVAALALGRDKAALWHGSPAGRRFHREIGKLSWEGRARVKLLCAHCGETYLGFREMVKRGFCSPACQGAARKKSGVDDEHRNCSVCGAEFRANKYSKNRTCGTACWKEAISSARKSVRPDGA